MRQEKLGSYAGFIRALRQLPGDDLTVFGHGYNTTSSDALQRFAQIGHDFAIDAPIFLFTSPAALSVLRDLVQSDRSGTPDLSQFTVGEDGSIRANPSDTS